MSDSEAGGREQDLPTHDELVEQAKAVLEATEASMYYPVAHGEAVRLQRMLERYQDTES